MPEIIQIDGKTCKTHILVKDKYITALETKLKEVVADIPEVLNYP